MMKEWREKMAGRDPVLKFHRLNPATENMERGIKASNQIDKTAGRSYILFKTIIVFFLNNQIS